MISKFDECTGCGACVASCPTSCIKLLPDKQGFLYPMVDLSLCVKCNKCEKVCPAKKENIQDFEPVPFAGYSQNADFRRRSSSGGIVSSIAELVFSLHGVVYGCGYNNLHPVQMRVDKMEDFDKIRRSKYVQSNTNFSYLEVKEFLENKKIVLYVGTPCIIAGLKSFLGKKYDNLITIDLLCHGVTSDELFQLHLKYLEKKYSDKIKDFQFRLKPNSKIESFAYYSFYSFYSGKKIFRFSWHDPFFNEYLEKSIFRQSCYLCKYANIHRVGDITVGDYGWGIKRHPELKKELVNEPLGLSCIIANSEKGLSMLTKSSIRLVQTKFEWIAERNETLLHPTRCNCLRRENFFKYIDEGTYAKWANAYQRSAEHLKKTVRGIKNNFKDRAKYYIKIVLKKLNILRGKI